MQERRTQQAVSTKTSGTKGSQGDNLRGLLHPANEVEEMLKRRLEEMCHPEA